MALCWLLCVNRDMVEAASQNIKAMFGKDPILLQKVRKQFKRNAPILLIGLRRPWKCEWSFGLMVFSEGPCGLLAKLGVGVEKSGWMPQSHMFVPLFLP